MSTSDAVVVGAGVFGAWTALYLRRTGRRVVLTDMYGPGNNRSSSGGESRIIRMGYGADEIYTRWAMRSRNSSSRSPLRSTSRINQNGMRSGSPAKAALA